MIDQTPNSQTQLMELMGALDLAGCLEVFLRACWKEEVQVESRSGRVIKLSCEIMPVLVWPLDAHLGV